MNHDRQLHCPVAASLCVALGLLLVAGSMPAQGSGFTASPLPVDGSVYSSGSSVSHPSSTQPDVSTGFSCQFKIAPGSTPAGGYLGLSLFGIAPVPNVVDDNIVTFNVPAYTFAGRHFTRVGFSSNGYAILGGATQAADSTQVNQGLPNSTAPNGVLAPFWTDLNPQSLGALRIGTLTNSSDTWIVLDWDTVVEYSTGNLATFEIWIGVDGDANPGEDITFAYGTIQGSGDGGLLTVGFEDPTGTQGQNVYFNGLGALPMAGTQLRITTCDRLFAAGFESK